MKSWLVAKQLNRLFYFLMAILVFACVKEAMKHDLDFQVFYKVGQQYLAGDYEFYQIVQYPAWPYRYGPLFPVFMAPFALLAKSQAQLLWAILNALIIPVTWLLTERVLARRLGSMVNHPGAKILTLIMVVDYITRNAGLGNVNMLMYLSLIYGVDLSDRKKSFGAALVVALGAAIKVYSGTAALYFLCTRKWRDFFWSAALTCTFTFIIPAAVYGPDTTVKLIQTWIEMLQDRSTYPFLKYVNQSPFAVFWRITSQENLAQILNLIFILGAFVSLAWLSASYWKRQISSDKMKKVDLMILLLCIAMPLFVLACVYIEYHLIAMPIILTVNLCLVHRLLEKKWLGVYWLRFIFVHLAVLEIAGRFLTEKVAFFGNHLFGLVALLYMIYFTLVKTQAKINHV